ncbi:hypothetical protein FB561_6029 [Kribbella amoyensis]|uniref:Uncharacterized protein n=1 Tax=Kribbella amoyensis TaxID=996641 RepID=A0A561C0Y2_9ACTN|nr:hypothetical protein [Kribbella amoyensis]TWD84833.1 hypothetical protein FB561_6029 [Kribbella amoyensis]
MFEIVLFAVIVIIGAVVKKVNERTSSPSGASGAPSPRVQRMLERIQAQQGGNQPTQFQGQYTQPTGPAPGVAQYGPGPTGVPQPAPGQFAAPGQYPAPVPNGQGQQGSNWLPSYGPPPTQAVPAHRPPQHRLPATNNDIDAQVRELMAAGNEVGAVRLLCDERDLDIIEAQEYARNLVTPAAPQQQPTTPRRAEQGENPRDEDENRYIGSTAFSESIFDTDPEENVWASGWTEPKDEDDRSDINELWETVRTQGRPQKP